MLRARVRVGGAWSDASILNLSPRGLMINASAASPGSGHLVEVRHGEFVILAEVVWRQGTRAGLRSESRVPVEDMLALDSASSLAVTQAQWPEHDRRKQARGADESRWLGRAIEFAGIAAIAVLMGFGTIFIAQRAFARPMAAVSAALGQ